MRATVHDVTGSEPVDLAERAHGLETPLEEPGIEVTGDHRTVLTGEGTGHPADAAPDLDQRLVLVRAPVRINHEVNSVR